MDAFLPEHPISTAAETESFDSVQDDSATVEICPVSQRLWKLAIFVEFNDIPNILMLVLPSLRLKCVAGFSDTGFHNHIGLARLDTRGPQIC